MSIDESPLDGLRDWYPGMPNLFSEDQNAVYAFLKRMRANLSVSGGSAGLVGAEGIGTLGPPSIPREWLGEIQEAGPEDEDNYEDARYWVRRMYPSNYTQDKTAELTLDAWNPDSPYHEWVTAHNIGEFTSGTHLVAVGEIVQVKEELDRARPRKNRFVFDRAIVPPQVQLVRVAKDGGSPGSETGTCSYTYAIFDPISGAELATGLTPAKARAAYGAYTEPTPSSYGLAAKVGALWVLLIAYGEVETVYLCDCEG
jgi:hypothetical protein